MYPINGVVSVIFIEVFILFIDCKKPDYLLCQCQKVVNEIHGLIGTDIKHIFFLGNLFIKKYY